MVIAAQRGCERFARYEYTAGLGSRFCFRWYGCLDVPMHQELCSVLYWIRPRTRSLIWEQFPVPLRMAFSQGVRTREGALGPGMNPRVAGEGDDQLDDCCRGCCCRWSLSSLSVVVVVFVGHDHVYGKAVRFRHYVLVVRRHESLS